MLHLKFVVAYSTVSFLETTLQQHSIAWHVLSDYLYFATLWVV
jgi:hypothetical protein